MSRIKIPEFIHEVIDDPRQRGILIAGSVAMFAVGLVPRVLTPGLPNAQEALRTQPDLQNLFLLLAFASTATIIIGGLVSDLFRRRSLLIGALMVVVAASAVNIVVPQGAIFIGANAIAIAATGVVLAYSIGTVAVTYSGVARATALGFVYGAFGAGAAASPAVLTLFPRLLPSDDPAVPSSFTFDTWLAYLLTAIAAGAALWAAVRWMPADPRLAAGQPHAHRRHRGLVDGHPCHRHWRSRPRRRGRSGYSHHPHHRRLDRPGYGEHPVPQDERGDGSTQPRSTRARSCPGRWRRRRVRTGRAIDAAPGRLRVPLQLRPAVLDPGHRPVRHRPAAGRSCLRHPDPPLRPARHDDQRHVSTRSRQCVDGADAVLDRRTGARGFRSRPYIERPRAGPLQLPALHPAAHPGGRRLRAIDDGANRHRLCQHTTRPIVLRGSHQ